MRYQKALGVFLVDPSQTPKLDLACESQKQPQEPHTGLDSENPLAKAVGCAARCLVIYYTVIGPRDSALKYPKLPAP